MALMTKDNTVEELQGEIEVLEKDLAVEGISDEARELIRRGINKRRKWIKKKATEAVVAE
jgi:hypothetical protein